MYDAVGIDMPALDFALNIPALPKPNSSVHFHQLSFQGGNKVSTGVVAAARLGARCAILGSVGDDLFGRFCCDDFKRHGIDCLVETRKSQTTAICFVLSDEETHGRSFLYHPGTCARVTIPELPVSALENTKYFYLAWIDDTVLHAIKTAKAAGAKIFVDADKPSKEIMDNIPLYDVFIASEFVYDAMFGNKDYEANCRKVLGMGPEIVVFTLGAKGCCGVSRGGEYFNLETYDVPVADTVGCGDVFHGAYLAALVRGMSPKEAARFSNAVSSIKCTRIGGRAGIPNYETVTRFMQTGEIDYTEIDERVRFYEKGLG